MNKLEVFLESLVKDAVVVVNDNKLTFQTEDLFFIFQRALGRFCWLDCCLIDSNGKISPHSNLRFDFPTRTIQNFLHKHTDSTLEKRHPIIHPQSVPNSKDSVVLPVYEAFVKAIQEQPSYNSIILRDKMILTLNDRVSSSHKVKL